MVLKAIYSGFKHLFKSRMTVKYPDQKLKMAERFLGRHILDIPTCIHCRACFRICPTKAITMVLLVENAQQEKIPEKAQNEEETPKKKKREEVYPQISYKRCIFCGFCVDVCPPKCLTMSHKYELSVYDKENLVYTPEQLSKVPSEEEGQYEIVFTRRGVSHAD
jgi:NADH-quinone oxidoreductase subunit I